MTRTDHPIFATSSASTFSGAARRTPVSREHSRMLAGMLLAAVIAALLVAADQVVNTWVDGHLLVGWVVLWSVAFAVLALLAPPLRQLADVTAQALTRWVAAGSARRADAVMWKAAQQDHRLMQDLYVASLVNEHSGA